MTNGVHWQDLLQHHHHEFEAGVVEGDKEDDDEDDNEDDTEDDVEEDFGCVSIYWL